MVSDSAQIERNTETNQPYYRLASNALSNEDFFIAERIRIADIRKCGRCQCQNCQNERNGILMVKPGEKRLHICPFIHCRKLYGKTSHLKVYNGLKLSVNLIFRHIYVGTWVTGPLSVFGRFVAKALLDLMNFRDT